MWKEGIEWEPTAVLQARDTSGFSYQQNNGYRGREVRGFGDEIEGLLIEYVEGLSVVFM